MTRGFVSVLVCIATMFMFAALVATTAGAAPLPLHGIEGVGGVFSTHSAHLVNSGGEDNPIGAPSVGIAHVSLGYGRHLEAFTVTETLFDRLEIGLGFNRFDLGDLPQDIERATGIDISDDYVNMLNSNLRLELVKESDQLPAITMGVHHKNNFTIEDIDNDLSGSLSNLGIEDDSGWDATLYATKMFKFLPRPFVINAGVRWTKAAHLGLLGFTDEDSFLAEGSIIVIPMDGWLCAAEYRMKPNEYEEHAPVIEEEDDWWTVCTAYVVNEHMTISGGYGHFGHVLNHEANGSWGFKIKWEY